MYFRVGRLLRVDRHAGFCEERKHRSCPSAHGCVCELKWSEFIGEIKTQESGSLLHGSLHHQLWKLCVSEAEWFGSLGVGMTHAAPAPKPLCPRVSVLDCEVRRPSASRLCHVAILVNSYWLGQGWGLSQSIWWKLNSLLMSDGNMTRSYEIQDQTQENSRMSLMSREQRLTNKILAY